MRAKHEAANLFNVHLVTFSDVVMVSPSDPCIISAEQERRGRYVHGAEARVLTHE